MSILECFLAVFIATTQVAL